MKLPQYVVKAMSILEKCGFEAYVVGGCVRDGLLGIEPHDWDVCTDATPDETMKVFREYLVIPTGLQHGTVTVLLDNHTPLEITTYRVEGAYGDHRRPDSVSFVKSIRDDLKRRDFTVNAMAYHPSRGLVDLFNGKHDLDNRLLRCVGNEEERFEEDALRILRALRFASNYGFSIEEHTLDALLKKAPLLKSVAAERVQSELKRMLVGDYIGPVLTKTYPVLFVVIPELAKGEGLQQHSPYHHFDVLQHLLASVSYAESDLVVRLAALLHDIGKTECFTCDENGIGHFYGHASISEKMAKGILTRLRFDNATIQEVCTLIRYHDIPMEQDDRFVRRWLNRLGVDLFHKLLALKLADANAHAPNNMQARFIELQDVRDRINRLIAEQACFSLRDLAIRGDDVKKLGIPTGKAVGECLRWALNEVIEQRLPNEKNELLRAIGKRLDYFFEKR